MFCALQTLTSYQNVIAMRKIKEMQAEHLYLIRGASGANSPFFENEGDCKLFLELADRFLQDYLHIASFQNNRDGWIMIIRTKSAIDIKRAYYTRRGLSKKCKKEFEYTEIWKILSDQIRIFLSTYVKVTNARTGRVGGKVRSRYERFVFESEEEALKICDMLEREYYAQVQPLKRYRPSKRLHKIRRKLLRTSIYMSCALLRMPGKLRELGLRCLDMTVFSNNVARHLISRTLQHHFAT